MADPQTNIRFLPWSVLALIITFRLLVPLVLPWGQRVEHHLEGLNDEPAHFNYVKFLAKHRTFPVLEHFVLEPDAFTRNEFEYHQAPLYYLICAPFYALLGEKHAIIACRLLAALAGLLTLWVLALFMRDLGCSLRVQFAAVAFTGFLPSHVYFSSFISNDPLSWLFAVLFARELIRVPMSVRSSGIPSITGPAVRTAIYLAAGLLTKSSAAMFFPIPFLVFGWLYWQRREARFLWSALLVTAAVAIAVVPWYARNYMLYHTFSGIPASTVAIPVTLQSVLGLVKGTIKYFWFPMQHLQGGTVAFALLTVIGGGILALHATAAVWWIARSAFRRELTGEIVFAMALFCLVAAVHAWYYFAWLNPEARFLFPALGPLCFFMIVPMRDFFCRIHTERFFIPYVCLIGIFSYPFIFFAG
jgi:4-amino-4-deoxy-L-arabinose transferase-like glycosyltransferase